MASLQGVGATVVHFIRSGGALPFDSFSVVDVSFQPRILISRFMIQIKAHLDVVSLPPYPETFFNCDKDTSETAVYRRPLHAGYSSSIEVSSPVYNLKC